MNAPYIFVHALPEPTFYLSTSVGLGSVAIVPVTKFEAYNLVEGGFCEICPLAQDVLNSVLKDTMERLLKAIFPTVH